MLPLFFVAKRHYLSLKDVSSPGAYQSSCGFHHDLNNPHTSMSKLGQAGSNRIIYWYLRAATNKQEITSHIRNTLASDKDIRIYWEVFKDAKTT